jgi:hypothetical protein
MHFALKAITAFVVGAALGLAFTWLTVFHGNMPGGVSDGPWRTNLLIGSAGGDMFTRASVAVHGLLALNRSETVYYTAAADSDGAKLDGRCTYAIDGRDPDTRWWSITAYAGDDYLIPNPAKRYSISRNSVIRANDGSFTARVSPAASGGNWIATAGKPFSLTLRLYNPGASIVADPVHAALPTIKKVSCP